MSIQVFLEWDGMDKESQDIIVRSIHHSTWDEGNAGYMHFPTGNMAVIGLISEAMHADDPVEIESEVLIERLPEALTLCSDMHVAFLRKKMMIAFVSKHAKLQEDGLNPKIHTSW